MSTSCYNDSSLLEEFMNQTGTDKKKSPFKRILKYALLLLLALLVLNVAPSFFYKPEVNANPLPDRYIKGTYHMHSVFSDGKGTVDDIAAAANAQGLDFVILTDHGRPNVKAVNATAWKGGLLLMGASELSLNCGHLAAVGFKNPDYIFPPEPMEAIGEINDDGGVTFISHPFDKKVTWTDWDIEGFTGLEVFSSYSEARKAGLLKVLIFPLKYLINSKYALLNTMAYPIENSQTWDRLNIDHKGRHHYYGIYALDAHAKLPLTKKVSLGFPTYASMFEIMTVYVNTGSSFSREMDAGEAMGVVVQSLREGNFFNVLEAIAPANGFGAVFKETASGKTVEMGGSAFSSKGTLVLELPFKFKTSVMVFRDGSLFKKIDDNNFNRLEIDINEPGVYRVEVFVPGNTFSKLPWIMANPFFIGEAYAKCTGTGPTNTAPFKTNPLKSPLPGIQAFTVEKNSRSIGELSFPEKDEAGAVARFDFKLVKENPEDKNFWSVMALRQSLNLYGFKGFILEAKSDKRRRFWMELRTTEGDNETWYRHSFLVDPEWKRFTIPFNKMYPFAGEKKVPDLSKVASIFISINNAIAYAGDEGNVSIKTFGLY